MIAAVCAFAGGLVVLGVAYGLHLLRQPTDFAIDLAEADTRRRSRFGRPKDRQARGGPLQRLGRIGGPVIHRSLPEWFRVRVRQQMLAGGYAGSRPVETYTERKAAHLLLYGGAGVLLALSGSWLLGLPLLVLGLIAEDIRLSRLARIRREEIDARLPDFLDVLAVVVSAGLSFRQGLARVGEKIDGPLAIEIQATLRQMNLGVSRRDAFMDLRTRSGSEQLRQFVTALLQAEELGTPLAETLMQLSADQRREAAQQARQRAARAAPRVSFVVSTVIAPGVMVLLAAALYYGTGLSAKGLFSL